MPQSIEFKILDKRLGTEFELPNYATDMAAGLDLRAMLNADYVLEPDEVLMVPAGFSIFINNPHLCAKIYPRSGLGTREGLVLANLTGIIDADYQGPIMIPLWNRSSKIIPIAQGQKIAQMVFEPIVRVQLKQVDDFIKSKRGQGGFGSTGN